MTLEQRVEKLERRVGRVGFLLIIFWTVLSSAAIALIVALVVFVNRGHYTVESLSGSDGIGRVRATLGVLDGNSYLNLRDKDGDTRIMLVSDFDGPAKIWIRDEDGHTVWEIPVKKEEGK